MKFIILIAIILTTILLIRLFRTPLRKWLYRIRAKLQIRSLRNAISAADDDKRKTDRKNMVVFNNASGQFEPLQKRLLKAAARASKNKNNAAKTKYRKKVAATQKKKKRYITDDKVKSTEKKSLYVTE